MTQKMMFTKNTLTLAAALGFCGLVSAAEVEWEPDIYPKNNIFPSLIIGTARVDPSNELFPMWEGDHHGDSLGQVGAMIEGVKKGDKFKLVIAANDLMKESKYEGVVEETPEGNILVYPKISYFYDKLSGISQVVPMEISMELFVNGQSKGEKTETVTLRSVNDCLFGVLEEAEEGEEGENSDYSWLFTAYVNENHPWVDLLLKEALQTGIVTSFDGYQSESTENVLMQIFAIWNVMQMRGIKYSDITTTAADSDGIYSQHVRLLDEAVDAAQANCVDGSVMLAALLRKIGLDVSLVLVPGHMYLAVSLDDETTIGIETTLMGEKFIESENLKKLPQFDKLAPEDQEEAWNSFDGAVATGTQDLEEHDKDFESSNLEYQIINLDTARKAGILPIPSKRK